MRDYLAAIGTKKGNCMNFERVKSGPYAGELVRVDVPPTSIRKTEPVRSRSRTGYGSKIPLPYMVRTVDTRWRRVYCAIYSNVGTTYVMHGKEKTIVELLGV